MDATTLKQTNLSNFQSMNGLPSVALPPQTAAPIAADSMKSSSAPIAFQPPQVPAVTAPMQFDPKAIQARTEEIAGVKQGQFDGEIARVDNALAQFGIDTPKKYDVRQQQEAEMGLKGMRTRVNDLMAQSLDLGAQYENVPTNVRQEGTATGQLTGFIDARVRGIQDRIASKQRLVNAQLLAAQGSMSAAQAAADRAVEDIFSDITTKQQNLKDQRQRVIDAAARGDIKLSKAQELALKEQERKQAVTDLAIADQKEQRKGIENLKLKLTEYGQDPNILNPATTINEAINIAGTKLRDPKAILELKSIKLDMAFKNMQMDKMQKEINQIGKPTATELKETAAKQSQAKAMIPVLQDKITAANNIKTAPGKAIRVGPSRQAREGYFIGIPGVIGVGSTPAALITEAKGQGQAFSGAVHKLTTGLTLDALIAAKERGVAFGGTTENELKMVADSATALNDWEIKDSTGKGTGYWNISEEQFDKEVDTIVSVMTKEALSKGETIWSPEEKDLFSQIEIMQNQTTPDQFYQ